MDIVREVLGIRSWGKQILPEIQHGDVPMMWMFGKHVQNALVSSPFIHQVVKNGYPTPCGPNHIFKSFRQGDPLWKYTIFFLQSFKHGPVTECIVNGGGSIKLVAYCNNSCVKDVLPQSDGPPTNKLRSIPAKKKNFLVSEASSSVIISPCFTALYVTLQSAAALTPPKAVALPMAAKAWRAKASKKKNTPMLAFGSHHSHFVVRSTFATGMTLCQMKSVDGWVPFKETIQTFFVWAFITNKIQ